MKSFTFTSCLKHADVIPSHKKCNKSLKANYRSVSILPILSKVFERSMLKQMSSFFMTSFQNISMTSEKGLVLNNVS